MNKKRLLFVFGLLLIAGLSNAQSHRSLPIFRYFNAVAPDSLNALDSTSITYGGWSIQSASGTRAWQVRHTTTNYYVECNGYLASGQVPQEQWFISPGFSTITYTDAKLNFVSCDKFNGTPMQVLVSTNYDGISLPSTANWVDITSQLTIAPPNPSSPRVWIPSGGMSLSSFVGNNVFVGFKYLCDSTTATDWEVDSISITSNLTGLNMHQGTNDQISVYPNPAVNHAEIRCASGMVRVELFNAIGNRVQTEQLLNGKQYQVDLSDLPTGIYFATVYTATGEQFCHKIVKQ